MENQSSLFFIYFSLLSIVAVAATHFCIKEKLVAPQGWGKPLKLATFTDSYRYQVAA